MTTLRILVTGSRNWDDRAAVWAALDNAITRHGPADSVTVVHGGALGADEHADNWVTIQQRRGYPVRAEVCEAQWGTYGRAAGPLRNQRMVDAGADLCLAFVLDGSRGATHCAGLAEAAGIPTVYDRRTSTQETT